MTEPVMCPSCYRSDGSHTPRCLSGPVALTLAIGSAREGADRPKRLIEDARPIKAVHFSETGAPSYTVGVDAVTRIEPYEENGEMAAVTWLAVWRGEHLWLRFPARDACVEY